MTKPSPKSPRTAPKATMAKTATKVPPSPPTPHARAMEARSIKGEKRIAYLEAQLKALRKAAK